jgi:hypothetical protein
MWPQPTKRRVAALVGTLAVLSALWVLIGPLYAKVLAEVLDAFAASGVDVRTRDDSIYVIATRFSPETRQTNINFHSFLLSYGYLVAAGLFVFDQRRELRPRLVLLGVACLSLLAAQLVGLYVAGLLTRSWLEGGKTPDDISGAVTTLSLAWALVPAAAWVMGYLHSQGTGTGEGHEATPSSSTGARRRRRG